MRALIDKYISLVSSLKDLPPLFFRLILAYGFYEPAIKKLQNIDSIAQWFASMNIPAPTLNAYMATATENIGFVLLFLGLGTRFITVPLMFVMIVAMKTVHWEHGFACSANGIEIPFYYFFMLFSLLVTGAGRISLDFLISKKR